MPKSSLDMDSIFHSFENQRVMVVGDVMLDRYVTGRADRISPEAPVPVLEFEQEDNRLGGAANVALNLKSLGATPILCGVVGKDADGLHFLECMEENGIAAGGIIGSADRITTVKTRIIAGKQQLLRLDKEQTHDLSNFDSTRFLENAIELLEREAITGVIFQDYNKGVLTQAVIQTLIHAAKKRGIPISVDPKRHNFWSYYAVDLFKPNLKEVRDALQTNISPHDAALKAASKAIRDRNQCQITLITLSEQGVFLDDGSLSQIFPTHPRTVADVCGAGDTVISIAALALSAGLSSPEIALLANLAGGQVVEKTGVVSVDKEKLRQELLQVLLEA